MKSPVMLSHNERRVLKGMAEGLKTEAIARREGIGERKVQYISGALYRKLGAINAAQAVAQAFVKGHFTPSDIASTPTNLRRGGYQRLSPREQEVLQLLLEGCDDAEVATRLSVSRGNVRVTRHGARSKLGVKTDEDAIEVALLRGFIKS